MRYFYVLLLTLNTLSVARSNDTSVEGAGGSWRPVRGEHPTVRMESESIRIDIYGKYYETVADFEFVNTGSATNAKMGFPEDSYPGDQPNKSSFIRFSTSVDGKPAPVKRVLTNVRVFGVSDDGTRDYSGISALWIKDVRFAKGQRRKVQVRYRSELGGSAIEGPNKFAPYDFTGGNWHSTVKRSALKVVLHEPGYYMTHTRLPGKAKVSQTGAQFDFVWTDWQAQGSFTFWLAKTTPEWMILPGTIQFHDDVERTDAETLSLLKIVEVPGRAAANVDWAPPILTRDDVLFVRLTDFETTVYNQSIERKQLQEVKTHSTRTTGAISIGATRLSFWTDQRKMLVEGQGSVELPALPFRMGDDFYVPLEPVVKALGGTLNINKAARRVYFTVPNV